MSQTLPNMLENTIAKIKEMIDVNSVIGNPITTPDGVTIIPVSKVSVGFGGGGSDYAKSSKDAFGGGAGGAKAHGDLGNGDDGHTVGGGDGIADDGVDIHHLTDLLNGIFQHVGKFLAHFTAPPFLFFLKFKNSFTARKP